MFASMTAFINRVLYFLNQMKDSAGTKTFLAQIKLVTLTHAKALEVKVLEYVIYVDRCRLSEEH
jgi:hypothetical protein